MTGTLHWGADSASAILQNQRGDLGAALATYRAAEAGLAMQPPMAQANPQRFPSGEPRELSLSYQAIGDVQTSQGDLSPRLPPIRPTSPLPIAGEIRSGRPWRQRDLTVVYRDIGDVQIAQGNLPDALKSYQAGFAIAERLTKSNPSNIGVAARSCNFVRRNRRR